jgi:hypothetical protein
MNNDNSTASFGFDLQPMQSPYIPEYLNISPSRTQHSPRNGLTPVTVPLATSNSTLTPEDQKETCIQKLSDLNAELMKNLNRLTTCSVATSFIFKPSDNDTAGFLLRTIDGSSGQDNAVGKVLRSTEQFLQILRDFRQSLLDVAPPNDKQYEGQIIESGDFPNYSSSSSEVFTEEESLQRYKLLQSYSDTVRYTHNTPPAPTLSNYTSSARNPTHLTLPSNLAILTCYTCILESFEHIFHSLQHVRKISYYHFP